jgi:hypothetical protein
VEGTYERQVWQTGSIVLTLQRAWLTDVIDRVVIKGAAGLVDAPGNIHSGDRSTAVVGLTLPLARFGVTGGLLKAQATWQQTHVTDPLTGARRDISLVHPVNWEAHFTWTWPRVRTVFGLDALGGYRERSFLLSEIETLKVDPSLVAYAETKPRPDMAIRVELQNLTARSYQRRQEFYTGARVLGPPAFTDVRDLRFGRSLFVRARRMF